MPTAFLRIDLLMRDLTIADSDGNAMNFMGLKPGETKVFDLAVAVRPDSGQQTLTVEAHSYIEDPTPGNNQVVVAINHL